MKLNTTHVPVQYYFKVIDSPVGSLRLIANEHGLAGVLWENERLGGEDFMPQKEELDHPVLLKAEAQLKEYFLGKRTQFDLPLDFRGTPFQKAVWDYLVHIPFGETRSYKDVAQALGRPKAVRAVGAANGRNPIAIIAGCHRVIGANGSLTGFAGGLAAKSYLLSLESKRSN